MVPLARCSVRQPRWGTCRASGEPHVPVGNAASEGGSSKPPRNYESQEVALRREARWTLWFRRPRTSRGSGRTPTCLGLARSGLPGCSASVAGRRRGELRAPRAPQGRRVAPRPPVGPRCIRGKKLCGDVPLLPALPAHPGCHHDIASPPSTALTLATDLSPTDTEHPSEQANQRPPFPSSGQQQASARSGPTPLNGPLQPRARKRNQPLGALPAAHSVSHSYLT